MYDKSGNYEVGILFATCSKWNLFVLSRLLQTIVRWKSNEIYVWREIPCVCSSCWEYCETGGSSTGICRSTVQVINILYVKQSGVRPTFEFGVLFFYVGFEPRCSLCAFIGTVRLRAESHFSMPLLLMPCEVCLPSNTDVAARDRTVKTRLGTAWNGHIGR